MKNDLKSPKFIETLNDSINLRQSSNTINGMMNKTKLFIKKENIIFEETRKTNKRNEYYHHDDEEVLTLQNGAGIIQNIVEDEVEPGHIPIADFIKAEHLQKIMK
jgi:hypothetical protein